LVHSAISTAVNGAHGARRCGGVLLNQEIVQAFQVHVCLWDGCPRRQVALPTRQVLSFLTVVAFFGVEVAVHGFFREPVGEALLEFSERLGPSVGFVCERNEICTNH
jgi:hypothetical protein